MSSYVNQDGEISPDAPSYAEALEMIAGLETTIRDQSKRIGRLERDIKQYAEADEVHPQRREITALIERWREATGHPNAKISRDRIDLVKSRLKDGYSLDDIALAIDGLAAYPFVVNAKRSRTGKPSERYDALKYALRGGQDLEKFANLGAQARGAAS